MAENNNFINVGGRLHSIATGNVLAGTDEIYDDGKGKKQSTINAETDAILAQHTSIIQGLNSQNYETYAATNQTTAVTDVLPATGNVNTVYRLGNWNGSQFDSSCYTEYSWDGTQYVPISTKTQIDEVFDISAYHASGSILATYADLSAALDSNNGGGVPQSLQRGGMSIKFVCSSDNKYVQYRLMSNTFSTTESDWQGVDNEPTTGSDNLIKSGGVAEQISQLEQKINKLKNAGYLYAGIAIPTTDPGTPNSKVFYIANGKGIYINFENLEVTEDEVVIFYYDTIWHKVSTGIASQETLTFFKKDLEEKITEVKIAMGLPHQEKVRMNCELIVDWTNGVIFANNESSYFGAASENSSNKYAVFDCSQIQGKTLYYKRTILAQGSAPQFGLVFYSSLTNISQSTAIDGIVNGNNIDLTEATEELYAVEIPQNAMSFRVTVKNELVSSFEAYTEETREVTTDGLLQDVMLLRTDVDVISNRTDNLDKELNGYAIGSEIIKDSSYFTLNECVVRGQHGLIGADDNIKSVFVEIPKDVVKIEAVCLNNNNYYPGISFFSNESLTQTSWIKDIEMTTISPVVITDIPNNATHVLVVGNVNSSNLYVKFYTSNKVHGLKDEVGELKEGYLSLENRIKPRQFSTFFGESELNGGEVITLAQNHIHQNYVLSAKIIGLFDCVNIGVGYSTTPTYEYRDFSAYWAEIDRTSIRIKRSAFATFDVENINHSFTFGKTTYINIVFRTNDMGVSKASLELINEKGERYLYNISTWDGCGTPFVEINGTNSTNVQFRFMVDDVTKNVWIFGDSMLSYWIPKVHKRGYVNYLLNYQPGLSPKSAYSDLENISAICSKPSYLVWLLGANGSLNESKVNGEYVISPIQKEYIDKVKNFCEDNKIIPVFACVPTFPTRQRKGFVKYIKSLGYRYVDLDSAVGSDEYGIWQNSPSLLAWNDGTKTIYTAVRNSESPIASGQPIFDEHGTVQQDVIKDYNSSNKTIIVTIEGNDHTFLRYEENDIWGLIGNDGLHPTDKGAEVYTAEVISSFPEISIIE